MKLLELCVFFPPLLFVRKNAMNLKSERDETNKILSESANNVEERREENQ